MPISNEQLEVFAKEYKKEEQEILVLFSDSSGGAGRTEGDVWSASAYFLAYQDLKTGEVKKGDGRIAWPVSDADMKQHGCAYPHFFRRGEIYRLRVRDLADRTVPPGRLPSFYNRFLVVAVLEENVQSEELCAILEEYRTPVILKDAVLGEFTLNKNYSCFEGEVNWLDGKLSVHLEVDKENEQSWTKALHNLRALCESQREKEEEFRRFAAAQLTGLANDWLEDADADEITPDDFARRISIVELTIDEDGSYTAYYNDDDMFYGHSVTVYGSIKSGPETAQIEG